MRRIVPLRSCLKFPLKGDLTSNACRPWRTGRRPLGEPMGNYKRVAGGAIPAVPKKPGENMTGDWVYTRSFAGKHGSRDAAMRALEAAGQQQGEVTGVDAPGMTHMWLNLTDGAFWKHAKSCAKPHPKTAATCPQVRLRKAVARADRPIVLLYLSYSTPPLKSSVVCCVYCRSASGGATERSAVGRSLPSIAATRRRCWPDGFNSKSWHAWVNDESAKIGRSNEIKWYTSDRSSPPRDRLLLPQLAAKSGGEVLLGRFPAACDG